LLEGNLDCPESIPLFLRPLKAETIRDVLFEVDLANGHSQVCDEGPKEPPWGHEPETA